MNECKRSSARTALTAALTAWQSGQAKPGKIESAGQPVQVADKAWEAGAKLKEFEIVKALEGDSPRKFQVKLTLEKATAPQEVVYVVVGKNPLWVLREAEYQRDSSM